jgi:high-affinity nickel-transport protein
VLLSIGVRALAGQVEDDGSTLQQTTGIIGTAVSGTFLMILAVINLVVLNGIIKVFRRMRKGDFDEAELEDHLNKRGFMNRILGGATKAVRKSWHMYPIGLLFGLGFDTATEISLLVLAGGAAAFQLPWYAILTLPILFAAGMSLLDTIDGSFMNFAYDWAFSKPVRKVYYNITITALSVAVALIIGGDRAHLDPRGQDRHRVRPDPCDRRPQPELRRLRDRGAVRHHVGRGDRSVEGVAR